MVAPAQLYQVNRFYDTPHRAYHQFVWGQHSCQISILRASLRGNLRQKRCHRFCPESSLKVPTRK